MARLQKEKLDPWEDDEDAGLSPSELGRRQHKLETAIRDVWVVNDAWEMEQHRQDFSEWNIESDEPLKVGPINNRRPKKVIEVKEEEPEDKPDEKVLKILRDDHSDSSDLYSNIITTPLMNESLAKKSSMVSKFQERKSDQGKKKTKLGIRIIEEGAKCVSL